MGQASNGPEKKLKYRFSLYEAERDDKDIQLTGNS